MYEGWMVQDKWVREWKKFVLSNKKTRGRTDHAARYYRCRNVDSASEGRHVDVICYVKQEEME